MPQPRAAKRQTLSFDVDNFLRELDVIARRIERVAGVPAETLTSDYPEYDSACMVIIRLAGFLERDEYAPYMDTLTSVEKRALRTARNIAAHPGYQSMDDKLLWTAVTRNVPDMIERLRSAVQADR
ncbi:MAG: antitoxin [Actinomyces sp. oral taxon 181]|nr:antitoxin [Actinomyces sp. oral taxon 181]